MRLNGRAINNCYLYLEEESSYIYCTVCAEGRKINFKVLSFSYLCTSKRNNFLSFSAIRCLKTGLCLRS